MQATITLWIAPRTNYMPLLTELGWCVGASSPINMTLLTELSRSLVPLKTAKQQASPWTTEGAKWTQIGSLKPDIRFGLWAFTWPVPCSPARAAAHLPALTACP